MKLSIVTINYNDVNGLKKTVESVLRQTQLPYEHIIIDGASTDGSLEYLKSLTAAHITSVSEPDSGIYNAMNKGIKKATGSYVLILNSGDSLLNDKVLETALPRIMPSIAFAGGNLILDKPEGQEEKVHPDHITFSHLLTRTVYHPSTFIRRDLFDTYGLYNEQRKIVADWEFFFLTIGLNGEDFQNLKQPITLFDMQGVSSQNDNREKVMKERQAVFDLYLKGFQHTPVDRYLLSQLKEPSKRTKLLTKIEEKKFARKLATLCLKVISKLP